MKSKWKQLLKRSFVLVLLFALLVPTAAYAQPAYKEKAMYSLEEMEKKLLESDEAKQMTKSTVTFPTTSVGIEVGDELVFHVFRQGSTDKKATITLGTYDVTAGYAENYEILVDGEVVDGKANKILDGAGTIYDVYLDENVLEDADEENADATEEEISEQADALKNMASSMFDITFEKGETTKEIRIRGIVPLQAAGNKEFQLMVMECEDDMAIGEMGTVGFTVIDSREEEESEIEILADTAEVTDGYVTVMVERKGNTDSYANYTLSSSDGTAVNGEDFVMEATQLTFTPGVTQQRIHIPLVSGDKEEVKTFSLQAGKSEAEVTYTSVLRGATFTKSRARVDIPMSEFVKGNYTADKFHFAVDSDNSERYIFSFDTGVGDADYRTASIHTKNSYDFTGIEYIRLSASYRVGTIIGDHLTVYASNTDYYNNLGALASVASNGIGWRIGTTSLTGQGIHDVAVNRIGEYQVYMTAEQHDGCGYIGYNLYDQEFSGDKGHVALMKKNYKLELVNPQNISEGGTSSSPAGDLKFTLTTDSSISGKTIDIVYRDDSFTFSYNLLNDEAFFKGYQILDGSGNVIFTRWTESNVFTLDSQILSYIESASVGKVRVRPVFDKATVKVTVKAQDFKGMGLTTLSCKLDEASRKAVYYDNGIEIATVTWNKNDFRKGDTLSFNVTENYSYTGDYHFDSLMVRSSSLESLSDSNPIYYSSKTWSTTLDRAFYEVTPMISCAKAPLYLNVKNATHGNFLGKPENLTSDTYTVTEYDGKYETTDIVTFTAKPDSGYRAKWTYTDTGTRTTKTYYGDVFHYQVQFPIINTDNYVTLEFEAVSGAKEYTMLANVYMQGGDVLHQPDPDCTEYAPLESAQVSVNAATIETDESGSTGSTGVFKITGKPGEKHTALVMANNRLYVQEFTLPESNDSSFAADMYLSYYYEGPRVTSVKYFDKLGNVQNGDTIFLEDSLDSVVVSAQIEENNKEVTHVLYHLMDSEGNRKMDAIEAERNGNEFLWSIQLGTFAQEGDQIWIELVNRQTDADGKVKETSYGKVDTGYNIVVAEYKEVSYIPDTGNKAVNNVPFFGNMFFNFSIKGFKPIITTSRSGNMYFLTIGLSPNVAANFSNHKGVIPDWSKFKQNAQAGLRVFSTFKNREAQMAASQTMKKNTLAFNFPVTFTLGFYIAKNPDTKLMESYFVGAYFSVGVNATYLYSYPFLLYFIPLFVNVQLTGSFTDTIQIYENTTTGLLPVALMNDPSKSAYRPDNDLNTKVSLGISVGAGVNSVLSVSGGGTGAFILDWVDYSYGKGLLTFTADIRIELILGGKTFSPKPLVNYELFNTNPYTRSASAQEAVEMEDVLSTKLGDIVMKDMDEYDQTLEEPGRARSSSGVLIKDAFQFSRPEIVAMGGNQYLIIGTVSSDYIKDYTGTEKMAVMGYAVYDANTKTFVKNADDKVFTSLEPLNTIGDSINFNPSVTKIDENKYAIAWNSVLFGNGIDKKNLTVADMKSVIKSAVVSTIDGVEPVYNSVVVTNESNHIMPSLVMETVYDKANQEVLLLYRTLDFANITKESTLRDYGKVGTSLSVASLKVDDASLAQGNHAWSESVQIAVNASGSVIKNADMAMMKNGNENVPIIAYHMAKGENAGLLHESTEDTTNHIYLTQLSKNTVGYQIEKSLEVPVDATEYQANPQLATGAAGGTSEPRAMLMWRQAERIAAADPIDILNGAYDSERTEDNTNAGQTTGLATINDVFAGNNDDYQLIEGDGNRLYCLWTEGYSDMESGDSGSKIMMSTLEQESVTEEDGTVNTYAYWTKAQPIFVTTDRNYVQDISAVVNENGLLHTLYRQTDLSDADGDSNIFLKSQSDLRTLLAEPKENISVETASLRSGIYASAELKVDDIQYVPLNVHDGVNADTYKVIADVINAGEADSEESELIVSYLESKNNAEGVDDIQETKLGQCTVPALAAGESATVEFEITVDPSYYGKAYFKIAPIGVALYENYDTDEQNMVDMMLDGVQADVEEAVEELEVPEETTISMASPKSLEASVYPRTAQRFTDLDYKSLNPDIFIVDENGVITGLKKGTGKVEITTENGIKKVVTVNIVEADENIPDEPDPEDPNQNKPEPKPDADRPDTGDHGSVMTWAIVCMIAAAGVIVVLLYKKKKK